MGFVKNRVNGVDLFSETISALPADTTQVYSSVIKGFVPDLRNESRNITIVCTPSAITGTNLDIALYGSKTSAGTSKFLLKDAVVADLTADATAVAGVVDLNDYPAAYYFLGITADTDESANSMVIDVMGA